MTFKFHCKYHKLCQLEEIFFIDNKIFFFLEGKRQKIPVIFLLKKCISCRKMLPLSL